MSDDETIIRVWIFADVIFAGQLVLERYIEYHIKEWRTSGYHDYDLFYEGKSARPCVNGEDAIPKDVIDTALSMAKWPVH